MKLIIIHINSQKLLTKLKYKSIIKYVVYKGVKNMLAKIWKKICLVILIIACLFNIVSKLVKRVSLNEELLSSAQYMYDEYQYEQEEDDTVLK